jgi:5'-3' exonuclease
LALAGDDADNIPGVRNIGFKTAEKLLAKHGGLEGVIAAAAGGKVERFGLKNFDKRTGAECPGIAEMQDQLRLNLKLTTLNRNADLIWTKPEQDEDEVARRFREMKFASFTSYADLQSVMSMGVASW